VSFAAHRANALSGTGAVAATLTGILAVAAGWSWGILLIGFFLSGIVLSRIDAPRKAQIVDAIVAKNRARDVWQVLANGGLFTAAALASIMSPAPVWFAIGIGALAASAADTWATELGTLVGGEPRSIVTRKAVPAGTSGGVTLAGSAAALAGAAFMAGAASLLGWPVPLHVVIASGLAGAFADSLAGALVQERRWCAACRAPTERIVHVCGTRTGRVGGVAGFDNDVVNLLCSFVGALVALVMS
jgi:uncharacterized protein (TIGR00297 family)